MWLSAGLAARIRARVERHQDGEGPGGARRGDPHAHVEQRRGHVERHQDDGALAEAQREDPRARAQGSTTAAGLCAGLGVRIRACT
eukprot:5049739-Alexandrium_andersonii.AAC.1